MKIKSEETVEVQTMEYVRHAEDVTAPAEREGDPPVVIHRAGDIVEGEDGRPVLQPRIGGMILHTVVTADGRTITGRATWKGDAEFSRDTGVEIARDKALALAANPLPAPEE